MHVTALHEEVEPWNQTVDWLGYTDKFALKSIQASPPKSSLLCEFYISHGINPAQNPGVLTPLGFQAPELDPKGRLNSTRASLTFPRVSPKLS